MSERASERASERVSLCVYEYDCVRDGAFVRVGGCLSMNRLTYVCSCMRTYVRVSTYAYDDPGPGLYWLSM